MADSSIQGRAKAFIDKYGKDIERANQTFFKDEESYVSGIYIDLACLKDTRMGLMLSLCSTSEEKQYLAEHLKQYNRRPRRTFVKDAYPQFKYSEEELVRRYDRIGDREFNLSPDTTLIFLLASLLNVYAQRKDMHDEPEKFTITLNCYPLPISDMIREYARILERYLLHHTTVFLISQDPQTLAPAFWSSNQVYFFDSLQRMLQPTSSMFHPFFQKHAFYSYFVYAPFEVEDATYDAWIAEGMDFMNDRMCMTRFEPTKVYLQLCCKFTYLTYEIPVPHTS